MIAVDSGGPKETIRHGSTGFLCPQLPYAISQAMLTMMLPIYISNGNDDDDNNESGINRFNSHSAGSGWDLHSHHNNNNNNNNNTRVSSGVFSPPSSSSSSSSVFSSSSTAASSSGDNINSCSTAAQQQQSPVSPSPRYTNSNPSATISATALASYPLSPPSQSLQLVSSTPTSRNHAVDAVAAAPTNAGVNASHGYSPLPSAMYLDSGTASQPSQGERPPRIVPLGVLLGTCGRLHVMVSKGVSDLGDYYPAAVECVDL